MSHESGRPEIDLAAFPTFTGRRQISIAGGMQPLWRADGKELFFLAGDRKLMAVEIKAAGAVLETAPVRELFQETSFPTLAFTSTQSPETANDSSSANLRAPNPGWIEQLYVVTNWPSLVSNFSRR
jgi:hypothetical protein